MTLLSAMLSRKIISSTLLLPGDSCCARWAGGERGVASGLCSTAGGIRPSACCETSPYIWGINSAFISHCRMLMKFLFIDKVFRFLKLTIIQKSAHTTSLLDYYFFSLFSVGSLNVTDLLVSFVPVNFIPNGQIFANFGMRDVLPQCYLFPYHRVTSKWLLCKI
jgi:hypothetical protein